MLDLVPGESLRPLLCLLLDNPLEAAIVVVLRASLFLSILRPVLYYLISHRLEIDSITHHRYPTITRRKLIGNCRIRSSSLLQTGKVSTFAYLRLPSLSLYHNSSLPHFLSLLSSLSCCPFIVPSSHHLSLCNPLEGHVDGGI